MGGHMRTVLTRPLLKPVPQLLQGLRSQAEVGCRTTPRLGTAAGWGGVTLVVFGLVCARLPASFACTSWRILFPLRHRGQRVWPVPGPWMLGKTVKATAGCLVALPAASSAASLPRTPMWLGPQLNLTRRPCAVRPWMWPRMAVVSCTLSIGVRGCRRTCRADMESV
ncbi:hypothetical protein GWK47_034623 [Chionoecetes opilio]|uniref:Uncharacterized protein n=1 Tax=Chionoecetes opilio TaxID=41210 RepID=A0A8J4YG07_CHIOP|nr:hypothetical protein GWK47_034623 [Chionoecetes opilio]